MSEQCRLLCGIIKDEALIYQLSEAEVDDIREDRLFKFLCMDAVENDKKWTFYDDEETEAFIDISDVVLHELLAELAADIANFGTPNGSI